MASKKDKDLETAFKDRSYSEVEILSKHDFKTGRKLNKSNVDEYIFTPSKEFSKEEKSMPNLYEQRRSKIIVDGAKEGKLISCRGGGSAIRGTKFEGVF
jgi:hypothetical protein